MTTESITSLGMACQILARPAGQVQRAAQQLKIKPTLLVDGVAHFSDEQINALREHFAAQDQSQSRKT